MSRLDRLTRKWWFILFIVLLFFLPAYSQMPVSGPNSMDLVFAVLSGALINKLTLLNPLFKIAPLLIIAGLFIGGNRFRRAFNIYATLAYFLYALLQNAAITEQYGIVILTGNLIGIFLVGLTWLREVLLEQNDFSVSSLSLSRWWVMPLAFFAFWMPLNYETLRPDFNLLNIITNDAGLAFCMMTPVYLSVLILFYPQVNPVTLRVTALAGSVIGFFNLVAVILDLSSNWWLGVNHLPLMVISLYALILSLRIPRSDAQ